MANASLGAPWGVTGIDQFRSVNAGPTPPLGTPLLDGDINAKRFLKSGLDLNTAGTLPNVAYLNQANQFTANQGLNNGLTVRWKDTAGTLIQGVGLGGDNTFRVGLQGAAASNGHLLLYANGVEVARFTPGTNNLSMSAGGAIDGVGALSTSGIVTHTGNPTCMAYQNVAQTIANATFTALTFDGEDWDVGSMHSTSVNTSRFTVPTGGAGKYLAIGQVIWAASAAGARYFRVLANGAQVRGYEGPIAGSTDGPFFFLGQPIALAAGDYVEFSVYQSSGGNLNTLVSSPIACYGCLMKVD